MNKINLNIQIVFLTIKLYIAKFHYYLIKFKNIMFKPYRKIDKFFNNFFIKTYYTVAILFFIYVFSYDLVNKKLNIEKDNYKVSASTKLITPIFAFSPIGNVLVLTYCIGDDIHKYFIKHKIWRKRK